MRLEPDADLGVGLRKYPIPAAACRPRTESSSDADAPELCRPRSGVGRGLGCPRLDRLPAQAGGLVICLGLNYRDHANETGLAEPQTPLLFAKYRNSLIGDSSPIRLPRDTQAVDFEGELAIVIGRRGKGFPAADALDYVAGAMAFNDVSARQLQFRTSQWLPGKALDTFAPCGPELVLADELGDLQNLDVATRVNGETMQAANTASMIFTIAETVAFIAGLMTLEPGDIIATGTPAGVGYTRTPPIELEDGDRVEVEIEGIGALSNPVERD